MAHLGRAPTRPAPQPPPLSVLSVNSGLRFVDHGKEFAVGPAIFHDQAALNSTSPSRASAVIVMLAAAATRLA